MLPIINYSSSTALVSVGRDVSMFSKSIKKKMVEAVIKFDSDRVITLVGLLAACALRGSPGSLRTTDVL